MEDVDIKWNGTHLQCNQGDQRPFAAYFSSQLVGEIEIKVTVFHKKNKEYTAWLASLYEIGITIPKI